MCTIFRGVKIPSMCAIFLTDPNNKDPKGDPTAQSTEGRAVWVKHSLTAGLHPPRTQMLEEFSPRKQVENNSSHMNLVLGITFKKLKESHIYIKIQISKL